jgi:hypothetical protein
MDIHKELDDLAGRDARAIARQLVELADQDAKLSNLFLKFFFAGLASPFPTTPSNDGAAPWSAFCFGAALDSSTAQTIPG